MRESQGKGQVLWVSPIREPGTAQPKVENPEGTGCGLLYCAGVGKGQVLWVSPLSRKAWERLWKETDEGVWRKEEA